VDYTLVFLKTGPTRDLDRDAMSRAMAGHFDNMKRLADAGDLLVAGPFAEPRVDPANRGIFVFDRARVDEGLALAATDPAAQAGVFVCEGHAWRAPAALRHVPALDASLRAELPADAGPGATGRSYVLARCRDAAKARDLLAPLRGSGELLVFGELRSEDPPGALILLDAADPASAEAILARAGQVPDDFFELHPWFATRALEQLGGDDPR
jgi:uncharacterized protein YciI